ncbi:MAG: PocR ligand-binding domain-containing protein [Eubacterium sp.]|nr:PocR ligand-binding domain-containing protein [Eubacterium sp.]
MEAYIYTIVEKEKMDDVLKAFFYSIELPIQLLDEEGNILVQYGKRTQYCINFTKHLTTHETCQQIHATAGRRAMTLGEAYIFSCHSNLSHIVFPLLNHDQLFGSVLVGPFLLETPDSTMVLDVGRRYPDLTMEDLMELYDDAHDIPQVAPQRVTQISHMLYYMFSNLLTDSREQFAINQKKLHQQAKISESVQRYKEVLPTETVDYPLEQERELLTRVKMGDLKGARTVLNNLLGFLLTATKSTGDVKNRCAELCSLLSRTAMENGAPSGQVLRVNNDFLQKLPDYKNFDDLCYALLEVLDSFMESMFPGAGSEMSKPVREAMEYITKYFATPLTLQDVAEQVHLNPSYFSRIFKQVTGSSFKEYLTMIRVEESKRLLQNTDYTLLSIAIAVGFEDQSYFSRVFKKQTGLTPKQFRG